MKKNLLALVAFSAIVFTSCSNEMDQMVEQQNEKNVIGFSTYSMMSKGTPITGNNAGSGDNPFAKDGSSFEVVAFLNDKTNPYLRAQIMHDKTSWNYFNSLDKAYWPNGADHKLNFFAVAPYSDFYPAVPATGNTVQYSNTADDKSMKITYTVPTITSEQQDLMYATTAPMTKPDNGGEVTLKFKHALNQIHFKGRTDSKNLKVIINPSNGIQLCNVYGSAVGTVAQGSATPATEIIQWSSFTSLVSFTNITPVTDSIIINTKTVGESAVDLTKKTDVLMLLPQPSTLLAWVPNPKTPPTGSAEKTGSYLKISCKLIALGEDGKIELAYLYGAKETFADMYVPFNCSAMEASGKKITYTLIFGGGYTVDGKPILTPITFDTAVTDWVEVPNEK